MNAKQARDRRMEGGYIPTALYVDAKSVFAAVTARFIKPPAEKSLLCHAQYLRELLDKHIIQQIFWVDTRDMAADGLTKGAVARDALHELMEGSMYLRHACEQWTCKLKGKQLHLADSSSTAFAHTFFAATDAYSYPQPVPVSTPEVSDASLGAAAMELSGHYRSGRQDL